MASEQVPLGLKFVFGGLSGMCSTAVTQPFDLVKTRLQVGKTEGRYRGMIHAIRVIARQEGPLAFYNGLSASLLRQATYSTVRLGLYTSLIDYVTSTGSPPNYPTKIAVSLLAGMIGALVGNPADLCLIRMTADGRLPPLERRNYRGVFDAIRRIVREEGLFTLWRGSRPTVVRAMVVNAAQLSTYSQAKQYLIENRVFSDGFGCHLSAAVISAIITAVFAIPVDITKTRIQNMKSVNGVPEYTGAMHVFTHIVRKEGFFALWRGFAPFIPRIGLNTVLVLMFLEQFNTSYFTWYLGVDKPPSLR